MTKHAEGYFPAFDIAVERGDARSNAFAGILGEGAKVEVKSQVDSRTHVFIEHEGYGKPSGISITEADYWVIECSQGLWSVIPIDKLWIMYWAALDRFGMSHGGDKGAAFGASIPKAWLTGMR